MSRETEEALETFYKTPDPWGYQTDPADIARKGTILEVLHRYGPFKRALDVACGEAWITKDIPAELIAGYEISDNARSRFPENVFPLRSLPLDGCDLAAPVKFDLVLCTGALYSNYDCATLFKIINLYSSNYIVTCHIADWEVPEIKWVGFGKQIETFEFNYPRPEANYTQRLRVFKK